ncbi:MAG TPA: carbohydrate kinase [Clostridiaceae bacterium]|nr:carbohydrate kinase [Clostridiaceae bacterium]
MFDVVAIGELLIDFAPGGVTPEGTALFERNPGGAPGNVLAILSKMGKKTALISKVGNDQFGSFLLSTMKDIGVDTQGIVITDQANTTLAFVHLDSSGDRSFSFYRKPGADMLLCEDEIDRELIKNCRIFHFGTVSMTKGPSRDATLYAIKTAKKYKKLISFDPNLRPPLWDNLKEAKTLMETGLAYTDILKVSGEELEFITGEKSLGKGSGYIQDKYGTKLILVTLGPEGCFYRYGNTTGKLATYDVNTIDTTGAGDAFLGAMLYKILNSEKSIELLDKDELESMIKFSNAAGSLATMKKGAIPAMPSVSDVENCIATAKLKNEL